MSCKLIQRQTRRFDQGATRRTSSFGFEVLRSEAEIHTDVAWHPDGTHILISRMDPFRGVHQLYLIPRFNPKQERRLPGQPDADNQGAEWSPDGSRVYFSTDVPNEDPSAEN